MYKPNFCAECGTKLLRLRWYFWTSRKFCNDCARRFRKQRFGPWLLAGITVAGMAYILGRASRHPPPPLTIIRRADSPITAPEDPVGPVGSVDQKSGSNPEAQSETEEEVYLCGARTRKGTPCSRRMHGPVRCWQHKGAPAMLPKEKLLVKTE
jgi:hypothetical protein